MSISQKNPPRLSQQIATAENLREMYSFGKGWGTEMLRRSALWSVCALPLVGCVHEVSNRNQFYQAQSYLPAVPPPPESNNDPVQSAERPASGPSVDLACSAGPVINVLTGKSPLLTRVLPGMLIRVVQTTYSATSADAVPVLTEWEWRVPSSINCIRDGKAVPSWSRMDMFKVRHLLSGAQLPNISAGVEAEYFQQAVSSSAFSRTCKEEDKFECLQGAFLDVFAQGLHFDLRSSMLLENAPLNPREDFDPALPAGVKSNARLDGISETTGEAHWYSELFDLRNDDLLGSSSQAETCAKAVKDGLSAGDPQLPQNTDVCGFSLATLRWKQGFTPLPGNSLGQVVEMSLLRSSDPYLLAQPRTHIYPLDLANDDGCKGDPSCPVDARTTQGFVQVDVLLPIQIEGSPPSEVDVPIGTNLTKLEQMLGKAVVGVRRHLDWLPETIAFADEKGGASPAKKLAEADERVRISVSGDDWLAGGIRLSRSGAVTVKDDLLVAPGDIIILAPR